uniref:SWIM-type domain-containing protein n=1 Tax=Setaria italica TaxID=4555 RepID=K3XRP7_SETIT
MEDKDKWAQASDEGGMRWGIMTMNYSESLNAVFKGIRSRSISGIIEYSFEKCNAYFVDRWQKAYAMLDEGHRPGKVADEFISEAELMSVYHLAEMYRLERMVYSIRGCGTTNVGDESHGGRHYRVDVNKVLCTCNVPQLLHLPCSHFITACKARGLNYESPLYMSPLYSRKHTIRIWESSFQPYLDPSQWLPHEGMAAPAYPLLEATYVLQHCTYHLTDLHEDLKPLRARVHSPFRWDERYAHYLQRAGFLDIAVQIVAGVPPMDGPLLTAMVDRWCPKTHTFHLPFGEMTIMMQDIAMILGLSLEGHPVMGIIQNKNWLDMIAMHIGIRPLELEDRDNSKKTFGVSSAWLRGHFNVCPEGANDEVVQRYTHVWLWHFVSTFLLPDAVENTVSWMVLPLLCQDWDNIRLYSWSSAVLAWLYKQLCEACRRTPRDSNVGGCTYMLQIWIWERMPVGRPCRLRVDHVQPVRGNPDRRYRAYTNELDVVTQHQSF